MYDVITKANGRDKVVDFRNNLVLAGQEDYAEIHGSGGKNYNSTIRCVICDFSKGKGEKSVTVGTNFDVSVIYSLYEVAKSYISLNGASVISSDAVSKLSDAKSNLLKMFSAVQKKQDINLDFVKKTGEGLSSALKNITESADYNYVQDKINVHNKDANGVAPVTRVMISHHAFYNGKKSSYPWYIKITSGKAPVITKDGGATTFNSKDLTVEGEAFINVSDYDMFRMLQRVVRFIELWEYSTYIPLLRNGLKKRIEERTAAANNRT
ncbi:MAG: hypothetical protein IJT36_09355 [Alphaproteobacteria bacterium]|nr:hypothetical protein [Alphaproteobacteria bacterium]